jgi:UDP-GlcNAc:undecaprenyl-phosphate GlcNAc-1-phosphate transferase
MFQEIYPILKALAVATSLSLAGYPLLIKLALQLGFTDKPNQRKVHRKPIPVVGGAGLALTLAFTTAFVPQLRVVLQANPAFTLSMLVLTITGIADDRLNLPAKLRLVIQLSCSLAVAHSGLRITSLQGYMGIYYIPVWAQYVLTVILITGVTNAVNLADGIDGLAGSLTLTNLVVISIFALLLDQPEVAILLLAVTGGLVGFLKYNWRPARIFMGDGGSLPLGFMMSTVGIYLSEAPIGHHKLLYALPVVLFACFAVPVIDALRVFAGRMRKGKSPFAADKTHLHHKLLQHFMQHDMATRKIVTLHIVLILCAALLHQFISMTVLSLMMLAMVLFYAFFLDFARNFSLWYRKIKNYENS